MIRESLVVDHREPQVLGRKSQRSEREVLGDRVVFAVSASSQELLRLRPIIGCPPKLGILPVGPAVEIDVDLAQLLPSLRATHSGQKRLPVTQATGRLIAGIAPPFRLRRRTTMAAERGLPLRCHLPVAGLEQAGGAPRGRRNLLGFARPLGYRQRCSNHSADQHDLTQVVGPKWSCRLSWDRPRGIGLAQFGCGVRRGAGETSHDVSPRLGDRLRSRRRRP